MTSVRPPERRQLTVMFCDMVASTALSLRLDPEELAEVLQAYRQRCAEVITRHGGIVARQIGDAVLAYFGYPHAHEDDAERAIRAALAIAKAQRPQAGSEDMRVHIGIATGVVVVGNLPQGGEELSAIGSALNLAARLEGLAGPGMVVVSDQTQRLARGLFEYRDLGPQDLRGFDEPVPAWEVLGERGVDSRFHALRASARTPLVDRQRELEELRRLWDAARAGRGEALLLSAEAGVGKSRLTDELANRIVDRRCLRLWYHCSPNLQSSPLAPLIRQLTLAAGFAENDDDETKLRKLGGLVPAGLTAAEEIMPLLADLLSIRYDTHYPRLNMSPQRQKQQLFQAVLRLLEAFAARGPVLVVVEDLHWIDPSSEELFGLLIDRLRGLPILAVLTARAEFQSHWGETAHLQHMSLSPLERRDSIAMIELLCGGRTIPAATIDQIADKTDGVPLFIEDVTRDVLEATDVQDGGSAGAVRGQAPIAIPATLTDSLMSRLDRLGSAKTVAEIGAVIGREFSYELLAKVAGFPEVQLKDELHRLVNAGLLVTRRSTSVLSYSFRHALARDAAYSCQLKKNQVSLHARIARVLVEQFPDTTESQPEVLAYHFRAANDVNNAVDYLVKAAKLSARRSGFVEAIAQLETALNLLGTQARSRERLRTELRVYRTLGGINAEYRGFSSAECGRAYTTALELCRELGDAPEIFSVLSGLGSFEITRAGFSKCQALAEECLSRAAEQSSKPPFVMGHLLFGGTLFLKGELAAARKHLEEAVLIYDQDQLASRGKQVLYVQDQKSTGLCYLGLTLTIMGDLAGGLRAAEDGLAHSRSLGGLHAVNFSLCYLAAVHHIRGDALSALHRATESLALAREQDFATWIGISQMIRGASLASSGNCGEGLEELEQGMKAHAGMDATTYQPFALALLVKGLIAAGRLEAALQAVTQALNVSETTGERFYAAELLRLKAEVLACTGKLAVAEQCLDDAITTAKRQEATLFELRSAASLCRLLEGSRREAALRDILKPLYDRFGEVADAPDVRNAGALLVSRVGAHNATPP
jgi:class 3 adenylate cyclase/tetratricopeptide (TPR) repeat protein